MTETTLKECPFCGLEPMLLETREVGGFESSFTVACYECGVEMNSPEHEDVVETWNRRAASQPKAA